MKAIILGVLTLWIAAPACAQGLTITMKETGPAGQTSPSMQIDRTKARLDIPSLLSVVVYDSETKTLRVLVPFTKTYKEYTPAIVQAEAAAPAGRGQPVLAKITYKRTGAGKVKDWTCTNYDGFRGADKVVEVCAAEGGAIGITRADFTLVQQAIDMTKAIAPQETVERIPIYGNVENQGFVGFPVRRVSYRDGKPEITTELIDFKREPVPASAFALPADFNKVQ